MNADGRGLMHKELTDKIIGVFYEVYNELGHGFLESVYEQAMAIALSYAGLRVERQFPLRVTFRGQVVGDFCADLIVERSVILELKAAAGIDPGHEAQLLNYLRATEIEVGLVLNFGSKPIQAHGIREFQKDKWPRIDADARGSKHRELTEKTIGMFYEM